MMLLVYIASVWSIWTLVTVKCADIVVVGDSWGTYGASSFTDMFTRHQSNLTVANYAVGGMRARLRSQRHPFCVICINFPRFTPPQLRLTEFMSCVAVVLPVNTAHICYIQYIIPNCTLQHPPSHITTQNSGELT